MKAVSDKVIQQTKDPIERPPAEKTRQPNRMPQPWVRIQ